ncbi:MAG: flagellar biosynthetic protein FliR, partial [Ferrimicrobium acidiphilum]
SPILAVMFFSQIVVGILTKVAPQLYALTFIFPLQILLSFIMMLVAVPLLPHLFDASIRDLLAAERDLLGG